MTYALTWSFSHALERRSQVRGSVVGPFSHDAFLLSCVVSSEFKQSVPAHKEHIHALVCLARQTFDFGHYAIDLADSRGWHSRLCISIAMVIVVVQC